MKQTYNDLMMIRMPSYVLAGVGYRWLVRDTFAHTAFRTKEGMRKFLQDTGLRIGKRTGGRGWWLVGSYSRNMMLDEAEFERMKLSGKYRISDVMSNGDYTTALIEEREDGNIIHYLNPNCNREVLPYRYD